MAVRRKRRVFAKLDDNSAATQEHPEDGEKLDSNSNMVVEENMEHVLPVQVKEKLVALSRCRYSSGGEIVVAEAGDEVIDPAPKDLEDLIEHGCVETFDPGQVQALLSIREKDKAAKQRLARMLGITLS